jgi:hypothetical protein
MRNVSEQRRTRRRVGELLREQTRHERSKAARAATGGRDADLMRAELAALCDDGRKGAVRA